MFQFFKRKNTNNDKNNAIKTAYLELLEKYTSISSSYESMRKDIKKRLAGKFINGFDCSMYSRTENSYEIRFKDDMTAEEFNNVFMLLVKEMGNPEFFGEYEGYIWKKDGYHITYGLVPLNHCYEVPMISVYNISIFERKIPYDKYVTIANAISKPLAERGIDIKKCQCYIQYFKEFGFVIAIKLTDALLDVHYKKGTLEVGIIPLIPTEKFQAIEYKQAHKKQIFIADISTIEENLDKLLEETKEYHKLNKII